MIKYKCITSSGNTLSAATTKAHCNTQMQPQAKPMEVYSLAIATCKRTGTVTKPNQQMHLEVIYLCENWNGKLSE